MTCGCVSQDRVAIYLAFCPASVGPFVSRPLRLLTTSPASSSSFKVHVRGVGWTRWLRARVARARRFPGDVLALASSLDSHVYHRLGEIVCEPHAHCVSESYMCARGPKQEYRAVPHRVYMCICVYIGIYVYICVRAGPRDSTKELETTMRSLSRALARAYSPDHLFRTRTLALD